MKSIIQTFIDDEWRECAEAECTGALFLWNYAVQYAVDYADIPVSLSESVDTDIRSARKMPAFLYDLVPQGPGRRFLVGELQLQDGPEADFPLICAGAFNPIGRLRVVEATQYFDAHVARHPESRGLPGFTIDEVVSRSAEFNERMFLHGMLGTGTTGVQGAAPKYLLTRDRAGLLHGDAILPDADATAHFIAKLPRGNSPADHKVLRNEAAYMRVAAAMGIRTHRDLPTLHGDVLLVPRFDRIANNGKVARLHQESMASILGLSGFDLRPSQFEIVAGIRGVVSDAATETLEFIKRDVLNLAMRNTDNHARNTAIQVINGKAQLTPLFDFAPMYLDPESIPRTLRWYRPDTRIELTEWGDILAALPIPGEERRMLALNLSAFANDIERLPDVMAAQGVDHDIIAFLRKHVETQVQQLKALHP